MQAKSAVVNGSSERYRRAALDLFAKHGFRQVSMRDLAHHIGISPGSMYHHFESKDQLLVDFLEEPFELLIANTKKLLRRRVSDLVRLRALVEFQYQMYLSMPSNFQLLNRELENLNGAWADGVHGKRQEYIDLVEIVLRPLLVAQSLGEAARLAGATVSFLESVPGGLVRSGLPLQEPSRIVFDLIRSALKCSDGNFG